MSSYAGRTIALASQHGKERVLVRPLRQGRLLTKSAQITIPNTVIPALIFKRFTSCKLQALCAVGASFDERPFIIVTTNYRYTVLFVSN